MAAALAAVMLFARSAAAEGDDSIAASVEATPGPSNMEAGLFLGGFISNYYHQFYDPMKFPSGVGRPQLDSVSPQFGARFAYFFGKYIGAEGEGSMILASTKDTGDSAQIYGLRAQLLVQYPGRIAPFVGAGVGLAHVSSDALGSDTDFPIHIGGGVRFFATKDIALRADARFLRGPSAQDPYTLNASYGEFSIGVSWIPKPAAHEAVVEKPDPDPDHDGIIGEADKCPNEPGVGMPDGCPSRDKDGDGIMDKDDKCPDQAETMNGWEDTDGCPDTIPDSDGDGLNDLVDKCKNDPEDKDGFQDEDGCPDPDNDNDGVMDARDKCPNVAGVVENNGCPDTDSDNDGIVDRLDNCPNEAGTDTNHGCKAKQLVVITKNQLQILDQVRFQTGTAKLSAQSKPLLNNIARVLLAHLEIWKVKVEGHTDNVGDSAKNQKLSEDRSQSVVEYLVKQGVAPERLEGVGHGDTMPLPGNDPNSKKGRELNRRVEFNIVQDDSVPPPAVPAPTPAPAPAPAPAKPATPPALPPVNM